ncbi:unnamed protein product [Arctogadus glacialis]
MVSDVRGLFVVQHREWILNQGSIQSPFVSHDHSILEPVWETQNHSLLTPTTSHHTEETSAISGHSETCLNKSEIPNTQDKYNISIGKKRLLTLLKKTELTTDFVLKAIMNH